MSTETISNDPLGPKTHLVTIDVVDGVGLLTLDNPPVNALSRDLRSAIIDGISKLSSDSRIQSIVLMGGHGTFIAGADLREFGRPLTSPTLPDVIDAIEQCGKPVIAAIDGAALGGGYEIALACDARIATEKAAVGLPEGTFGIVPGAGGTARLPRLTDAVTALEMIASCRQVKSAEARSLGLIDAIVTRLPEDAIAFAYAFGAEKKKVRDREIASFDEETFGVAVERVLKRGRGRPFVHDQVEAVTKAVTSSFDEAAASARNAFLRLRDSEESAALRHLFFAQRQASRIDGLDNVDPLPVTTIGIVGAGTMGCGISAAFLGAGYAVKLTDLKTEALASAEDRIKAFLQKAADPAELLLVPSVEDLADCDVLLEAVFEDLAVKKDLMAKFDQVAKSGAILASNTSYLDLNEIATATTRPEAVVGLHFFAPAHIMKLLEIVRGTMTSPQVLRTSTALAKRLRKVAVVSGVGEGFIGNRIYNAYRAQCETMLIEGASPDNVDDAIEALGFAMGPFSVSDLSGLDIAWANRKRKQDATGDKSRDVPVLEWLVAANRLGRKTGSGWYRYENGKRLPDPTVEDFLAEARALAGVAAHSLDPAAIQTRALCAIVNEALLVLEDGIASRASDIDLVLTNGYGFPKHLGGPLFWAKQQPRETLSRDLAIVAGGGRRGNPGLLD
ncbi:3-hydroxyacyl-CoA dehydrogenase NAD-binding domain-containing protein [Shinella sumterensis]|uniref:3-hydroxyacyl-CoA dehydrogenase NAD-binding domain-containing protein n=1 Tax=Shinella sumterensis TaxID=1967501 RepID=A0AA50DEX8_9HYPH|nr:3-hydroxyacyl-CoA dehydrogenase NAD-binding domain-containing protein [Shinella sumterensis]WLS01058.1 3-hydroxyacyl-CoA dehydrogenase NAD-binding domain-containing protein [Shinella sumterensis]WLS11854.1 3-hydroxyacyl-CoA dehydrogenase NAD-binding domain-containing protein [Shinella sumterensis]